jgi:XTP/dITP diphosphohydrolase
MGDNMISFITSNKGKYVEARAIIDGLEQKDLGYTEIQADTLEEVAVYGMNEIMARLKEPAMLEDAGLFIEALGGFPGVYSAYVQKTIGNEGILRLMDGISNRKAFFKSVVVYSEPGLEPRMFQGIVEGQIGHEARGSSGFGYDPIFYVGEKSLAEMELAEKNRISHRAASMRALDEWLEGR